MKNKKELSLKFVNVLFFSITTILCIALGLFSFKLVSQFQKYVNISKQNNAIANATVQLQEGSDYLTEEARFFILNADTIHMENYFTERNITQRREQAIEEFAVLHPYSQALSYLYQALNEARKLDKIEIYAMRLLADGMHLEQIYDKEIPTEITLVQLEEDDQRLPDEYKVAKAWLVMFSKDYMEGKHKVSELKSQSLSSMIDFTEHARQESYNTLKKIFICMLIAIIIIIIFTLVFFMVVRFLVVKPLYDNIQNIEQAKLLSPSKTKEFNILTQTYNQMYNKNEENEELLRYKAEHDDLTGLYNRGAYAQLIGSLKNSKRNTALIIMDVDSFKSINDNFGHPAGDKVLKKVANSIKANFRASDFAARIGGDEFTVIITDFDDNEAEIQNMISAKLEKIENTLHEEKNGVPPTSLSCGIAFSSDGYSDKLYKKADKALYKVKNEGRNGFRFYSKDLEK